MDFGETAVSPGRRGFRMPAEWEPHRATWIIWPHNRLDWEVKTSAVRWCFAEIVKELTKGERVALVVQDQAGRRQAERSLANVGTDLSQVEFYVIRTNRSWIRDCGPIFITRRAARGRPSIALTDWGFNGWARYRAWTRDNAVPAQVAKILKMPRFPIRIRYADQFRDVILEGGSIDVNGQGLLLTTEQCLLGRAQGRNPGLSRESIEYALKASLGIRKVLWLSGGIDGDDTQGHIDDVARFVAPNVVVAAVERDRNDSNYEPLQRNYQRLKSMKTSTGSSLRIVRIPMPRPISFEDQRLPATYLNFYIANKSVLVPTFNDPSDRIALAKLERLFPSREVIGIHAGDLVLGLGALHCLTQQEPA